MGKIYVLVEDVPYQVTVQDFDSVTHLCDIAFQLILDPDFEEGSYMCVRTLEIFMCDSLGRNTCTVDREHIGSHQETRFEDRWIEIQKTNPRDTKTQRQLLSKTIRSEFTPREKASDLITAGETKFYRIDVKIPVGTTNEFYIEAIGSLGAYGLLDPWYNSSWEKRKLITINSTNIATPLIDFPFLINFTDTDLRDDAQADGDDILFTNFDNSSKLAHEIERYTSSNGYLSAWVRIPILSNTTDTQIYMYYNNSAASNQQNITGTWNENYNGVWHLNDDFLDSTIISQDCTNNGGTDVLGYIADGQDHDGTNDYLICGTLNGTIQRTISNQTTWQAWMNNDDHGTGNDQDIIVRTGTSNVNTIFAWEFYTTDGANSRPMQGLITTQGAARSTTGDPFLEDSWNLMHWVADLDTDATELYSNGTAVGASGTTSNDWPDILRSLHLMGRSGNTDVPNASFDEIRFSQVQLSDDWIDYEYCNMGKNSFINGSGTACPAWSIGIEEEEAGGTTISFTDELAIEDSIESIQNFNDELGIEDTLNLGFSQDFTDELAIEDSIGTVSGFIIPFTDELAIEDTFSTISGFIISFTDELAIEDSFAIISGATISFTDELAIEDSFDFMSANTVNLLDELAIEDILAEDSNFIISFTDELAIEDSFGAIQGTIISFTDELAIEDSLVFELSVIYLTDELAIEDTFGTIDPIDAVFNALVITLNPAQNTTLGGSFAILCPSNSTLTGLFINGTFRCTPMSDFFP